MKTHMQKHLLRYKILILLVSLYVCIDLLDDVTMHRLVSTFDVITIASAFTYPLTYLLNDVITELFGFSTGRTLIWVGILCDFTFVGLTYLMIHLPAPVHWHEKQAYLTVLSPMARIPFAEIPGIIIGRFINIYMLSKTKVLLKGKYFWLRSNLSSCSGIIIHSLITDSLTFGGVLTTTNLFSVLLTNTGTDVFTAIFLSWIPVLIVKLIKTHTGIDEFDYTEKFNPFKI